MITPRLELIIKHVSENKIADIGTDHAYIPIELIKRGICKSAIATDISTGPAEIAKEHIKNEGLSIDVRIGGGLAVLKPGEVQQIIIAGMGGKMIVSILEDSPEIAKNTKLILQPMNGQYELRKYLTENNFTVTCEDIAAEGEKVYNLIEVNPHGTPVEYDNELDLHLPSFLKGHDYYPRLKAKKLREFNKILEGNKKAAGENNDVIKYYEELIRSAEQNYPLVW